MKTKEEKKKKKKTNNVQKPPIKEHEGTENRKTQKQSIYSIPLPSKYSRWREKKGTAKESKNHLISNARYVFIKEMLRFQP